MSIFFFQAEDGIRGYDVSGVQTCALPICVTPVASQRPRILATLNYNLENNIELSENARLTFFGRLQ